MLNIQLFGRFAVNADQTLRLQTNKIRGVVAYLAAHANRPINRTQRAYLFWPDKTDAAAARNLRNSLSRLQKAFAPLTEIFGEQLLTVTRQYVQLAAPPSFLLDAPKLTSFPLLISGLLPYLVFLRRSHLRFMRVKST